MELPGRAIAPGVACGAVVRNRPDLTGEEAAGTILVAERAVPDDVPRILACAATITGISPALSHVALLSRELGKPSVGLPRLDLVPEGAVVIVDGTRGAVVIQGEEVRHLHGVLVAFSRAPDDATLRRVVAAAKPVPRETLVLLLDGVRSDAAREHLRAAFPGLVHARPSPEPEPSVPFREVSGRLVVPFGPGLTREEAGGKAAGLSEIVGACRVPAGFVVTTTAYRLHIAGEIEEKLRRASEEASDAEASRRARAAIFSSAVPVEVRSATEAACRELAAQRLAVRSSATIEDGPLGSLAGLFDSSLGVRRSDLVDRVRATWASLWNERAIAFLREGGRSPLEASQAVLVQEIIPTSPSGVFSTSDDSFVVNAAWGLGEAIAQAEVAGDQFTVHTSTGEVLSSEVVPAATWIVLDPDRPGTVEQALPAAMRGRPCVTQDQLETLAALARTLGQGRIVEFGFDASGTLIVFQVRRVVRRRGE